MVGVQICFTSINSTYLLNAVGTVWCGVNPAAVRHHNAAADQRRCSLQPAACMQTQKCGGGRQLAPSLALAGVPRKALNLSRWPDWSGTAALQHCSQVPRVLWRAGAGDTRPGHGTISPQPGVNQLLLSGHWPPSPGLAWSPETCSEMRFGDVINR